MAAASLFPSGMTPYFMGNLCICAPRLCGPKAEGQGTSQGPLARGTIKYDLVRMLGSSEQRLPAP